MARNTLHRMIKREAAVCSRMKPKPMGADMADAKDARIAELEAALGNAADKLASLGWHKEEADARRALSGDGSAGAKVIQADGLPPGKFPRRFYLAQMTPAETAIREAIKAVEALPADTRLTDAMLLLEQAWNTVADYVDARAAQGAPAARLSEAREELPDDDDWKKRRWS